MKRTTQLVLIAAVALAGWTLAPASASAERVKTTRKTRIYARPGESARIIKRLPSGRTVTVLARKGRWIKVRVGSEIGYLTRTSVISSQTPRAARSTSSSRSRRPSFVEGRSRRSRAAPEDRSGSSAVDDGFEEVDGGSDFGRRREVEDLGPEVDEGDDFREGSPPVEDFQEEDFGADGFGADDGAGADDDERALVVARVNSDAYRQPNSRSGSVFGVGEGDTYSLVKPSESGKWMLVEDGRGDRGWVRADQVEVSVPGAPYEYEKLSYNAGVGMAFTAFSQQFRTADGVGQLANYDISSSAFTAGLQGEFVYKYSDRLLFGLDVAAGFTRSSPGIRFVDDAGNAADIPFNLIDTHSSLRAGYNFKTSMGLAAYGRAGFLYSQYDIGNAIDLTQNLARLPSEILSGVTVGAMVDAPQITDKIKARFTVDLLALGSREQTVGLEDGQTNSVSALWANLQVAYELSAFDLYGSVRYLSSTTNFAGVATESARGHNATQAERRDGLTTIGVGVIKVF